MDDSLKVADISQLKATFNNDLGLITELVDLFKNSAPEMVGEIEREIEAGDAHKMGRAAHTLKGSASNFAAERVMSLALEPENMGAENRLDGAETLLVRLKSALQIALAKLNAEAKGSSADVA